MTELQVKQLSASYGAQRVLQDLSFSLKSQQLLVILGPSGSGKTTLLNLLAGFESPLAGDLLLNQVGITGPSVERGVVAQADTLLPWLNVLQNIALPLRLAKLPAIQCQQQAEYWLHRVGLQALAERQIWQLSGGQKQRVSLARALAAEPKLLLLDEPFAALDLFAKEQMQQLLLEVWQLTSTPMLLITHDVEEALFLATDILLLTNQGQIAQQLSVDFSQRFVQGATIRELKSSAAFIAKRELLLGQILAAYSSEAA